MQGNSLARSAIGITQYTNPGNGGFAPIGPGLSNSVFWSDGVINAFVRTPIIGDSANTGRLTIIQPDIRTTDIDALVIQNPTPSTALVNAQHTGILWFLGSEWNTTAGASQVFGLGWKLRTAQTGTIAGGKLSLMANVNGVISRTGLDITESGEIEFFQGGAVLGDTGKLRTSHNTILWTAARNDNTTARLIRWGVPAVGAIDELVIGDVEGNRTNVNFGLSSVIFSDGTSPRMSIGGTIIESFVPTIQFDRGMGVTASYRYENLNTAVAAQDLVFWGQGQTAAGNNTGGRARIRGGRRTGSGFRGSALLEMTADDATFDVMVEAANVVGDNLVISLVKGSLLTSAEMPANTGNRVAYISECATAPTANAVGGGILYVSAGALRYRGPGGTDTPIAPS